MPNDRAELEQLRKLKRLKELEAKSGNAPQGVDTSKITVEYPSDEEKLLMQQGMPYDQAKRIFGAVKEANMPEKILSGGIGGPMGLANSKALSGLKNFFMGSAPKRIATAGALGAGSGAISDPENPGSGALKGLLTGAGIAAGGEGLAGLSKGAGDIAMQIAVGRKKYTPGVGTELANQGIVGTKGMMQSQVNKRLGKVGQQMQQAAENVPGTPISSPQIAQEIAESPVGKTGQVAAPAEPSAADKTTMEEIQNFINDISGRGNESAAQALARRKAAGERAYRHKEVASTSLMPQLSKQEQIATSKQLKDVSPEIAALDPQYAALKKGQAGLEAPLSLPQSLMGLASTGITKLPGIGGVGSLGASLAGQTATKVGQALKPLTYAGLLEALRKQQESKE